MYPSRDLGIRNISARRDHRCYGMGLGMILTDELYPGFPGDMRNPSAFPFPIQFEIAEGVSGQALIFNSDKSPALEAVKTAASKLERMGCRAIAGECGYFAYFQREIAAHVGVPVFMSSLLQVPWAQRLIKPDQVVGVLVAFEEFMTDEHLRAVGVEIGSNYVISGLTEAGCSQLQSLCEEGVRGADYARFEAEVVEIAREFHRRQPNMGALLLECSALPPFARAIQRALDLPVFSAGTLLDYAFSVVVHRDYYGHV